METLMLPFSPRFVVLTICVVVTALLFGIGIVDHKAFHIILVPLGVSWAFMTLIANYRAVKHNDADALKLAQRWS